MVNHSTSLLTGSGTSSCSECIDKCYQRRCYNTCLHDPCNEILNNRFYTILRKVCRKIFNDYNRSQCHEKYTVFDGGNSINVRIHRSGSRGNAQYLTSQEKAYNCGTYNNKSNNNALDQYNRFDNRFKGKFQRSGAKFDSEADALGYFEHSQRYKNLKSEKHGRKQGKDDGELLEKGDRKTKGKGDGELSEKRDRKTKYGNRIEREQMARDQVKYDDDRLEKMGRKSKEAKRSLKEQKGKRKRSPSQTYDTNENEEILVSDKLANQRAKKGNIENIYDISGISSNIRKRGLRTDKESEYHENGKSLKDGAGKDERKIVDERYMKSKRRSRKGKNKFDEYSEDYNEGYVRKTSSRKSDIPSRRKDFNLGIIEKFGIKGYKGRSKSFGKNNEYIKSDVFKINSRTIPIVTDLRNKVRRADNIELYTNIINKKLRSSKKLSRVDEIKTCDYLRALMEERDLCRLCCPLQLNPRACVPIPCPNTITSCFSEIYERYK
ncbi:uncharacterized protein ACRADG_009626 [Cochliomyia hominivorax]